MRFDQAIAFSMVPSAVTNGWAIGSFVKAVAHSHSTNNTVNTVVSIKGKDWNLNAAEEAKMVKPAFNNQTVPPNKMPIRKFPFCFQPCNTI